MPTECLLTLPDPARMGPLLFTATVNDWIADRSDVLADISRKIDLFIAGDWGDLSEEDWQANIDTIKSPEPGGRLMGAYKLNDRRRLWIITSGYGQIHLGLDYCYTTVMAPEDY